MDKGGGVCLTMCRATRSTGWAKNADASTPHAPQGLAMLLPPLPPSAAALLLPLPLPPLLLRLAARCSLAVVPVPGFREAMRRRFCASAGEGEEERRRGGVGVRGGARGREVRGRWGGG